MNDYTTSRQQALIGRLQQQVSTLLGDLFQQLQRQKGPPSLTEIERTVRRLLQPLGRELVREVVRTLAQHQTTSSPPCSCGEATTFEHFSPLTLLSSWGTITLEERAYFSCATCGHGKVPLDEALRIGPGGLSPLLEESLSLLGGCMPFELAVQTVERLLELQLPAKTEQRVTQRVGQELEVQQQEVIRQAWEDYTWPVMEEAVPPKTLYVSTDGAQVRLQDQYHEAKVGAFYESELRSSAQGEDKWHTVATTYVAAVDEPAEDFARRVLVEGYRRGWDQAERVVVLGDGAPWNWTHVSAQVPDGVQKVEVVDFYHAQERLWDVGKAVFGEGTERTRQWAEAQGEVLLQGGVEQVIAEVVSLWLGCGESRERLSTLGDEKAQDLPEPQKTLRENWTYFTRNRERMRYHEYRRQGLFIGSGTVESACKRLISARLKQSGMRWSKEGAHQVLQVRAAILSARDRWDLFWTHRHPPPRHHHRRARAA